MRKQKWLALILAVMFTATAFLAGCSKPKSGATGKLDADQTINIYGYDYKSLDASSESDAETFTTFNQVYEGLYRENDKHEIVPAGVDKTDISADKLTYTFHLKKDAKWSDGQPVKAKDYEFSWKRLINPDNGYDYMEFLSMVKNVPEYQDKKATVEDVGIKATDDYTLVVTLSTPTPYFINMLSFGCLVPQREDIYNSLGKDYGQNWQKMVYNGPFTISNYQKGSNITYKKNDNYWDAKNVKLTQAVCPIISETATLVQMFQAKQLDQVGASGDFIAQLDGTVDKTGTAAGGYTHITGNDAGSYFIIFNFKNPYLANAKIRQAMSAAFDRDGFLKSVYKRNIPAYAFIPQGLFAGDKEFRASVSADNIKSEITGITDPKALFQEGLNEVGLEKDPSKVTFKYLLGKATTLSIANGNYVQDQFKKKLGCNVQIVNAVDNPAYFQSRTKGEFDLCGGGWGADFNDVSNFMDIFLSTNGNNNGKYNSKDFDTLVKQADTEQDTAKRIDLYKQAEEYLMYKDCAIIETYWPDFQTFRYNWVKGLFQPLYGGYYCLKNAYIQGRQ